MKKFSAVSVLLVLLITLLCVSGMAFVSVLAMPSGDMDMSMEVNHALDQEKTTSSGICGACVSMVDLLSFERALSALAGNIQLVVVAFIGATLLLSVAVVFFPSGLDPPSRFDPLRSFLRQHRFVVLLE